MMQPDSTQMFRSMQSPSAGEGAVPLTEASMNQIANSPENLSKVNGDQARQIAEANPTEEAVGTLLDRDRSAAVDLAVRRADVATVVSNSDELPDTYKEEVQVRRRGA